LQATKLSLAKVLKLRNKIKNRNKTESLINNSVAKTKFSFTHHPFEFFQMKEIKIPIKTLLLFFLFLERACKIISAFMGQNKA